MRRRDGEGRKAWEREKDMEEGGGDLYTVPWPGSRLTEQIIQRLLELEKPAVTL